ncbi:MAG: hypothetical protein RLZZ436_2729, partial [Planctomycetota bacterium]
FRTLVRPLPASERTGGSPRLRFSHLGAHPCPRVSGRAEAPGDAFRTLVRPPCPRRQQRIEGHFTRGLPPCGSCAAFPLLTSHFSLLPSARRTSSPLYFLPSPLSRSVPPGGSSRARSVFQPGGRHINSRRRKPPEPRSNHLQPGGRHIWCGAVSRRTTPRSSPVQTVGNRCPSRTAERTGESPGYASPAPWCARRQHRVTRPLYPQAAARRLMRAEAPGYAFRTLVRTASAPRHQHPLPAGFRQAAQRVLTSHAGQFTRGLPPCGSVRGEGRLMRLSTPRPVCLLLPRPGVSASDGNAEQLCAVGGSHQNHQLAAFAGGFKAGFDVVG